jgi:hypothetical protein
MGKMDIKRKDNPRLLQKPLKDGRQSLFLEYYFQHREYYDEQLGRHVVKHDRRKEALGLYLLPNPRTPYEREQNRIILEEAQAIRLKKEEEFKSTRMGYNLQTTRYKNFFDWFDLYISHYTKADIKHIVRSKTQFQAFLKDHYPFFSETIKPEQISKVMVQEFVTYLQHKFKGEGPHTVFQRFKKVIRAAVDENVIAKNPCLNVVCKIDTHTLRKEVLSKGELQQLLTTDYSDLNTEVCKAFIFTLYTGARFCDVSSLRFSHIDYGNKLLLFEQKKTKGRSSNSHVEIPLSDELLSLIGARPKTDELIFQLPTATGCQKMLTKWVKRAGIDKHITWHCGRHSFATLMLANGVDVKTTASLLGHSGLKHVDKYVRAVDHLKRDAIKNLPTLNL